jgi:putative ABC transport system permease protein
MIATPASTRLIATSALLAVRAIRRHVLRSFLTVLGIVIGVFAVVTMVTLGKGASRQVHDQVSGLGANVLTVLPGTAPGRGGGGAAPPPFKPEDIDAIRDQIGGVTAVAAQAQVSATAVFNAANWQTTVNGASDAYLDAQNWALTAGRRFTADEEQAGKSVCLVGSTVAKNLYANQSALGTTLRVGTISCTVVGALATRGQGGFGQDNDDAVIMPIKAVQRRLTGNRDIRAIIVAADPAYDSKQVQQSIAALLRERRNIHNGKLDDFTIFDSKQIADTLASITGTLTAIVSAVAGISLLVGGIGIMNIMLVSVTERARDWHPPCYRRIGPRGHAAVSGRSGGAVVHRRPDRAGARVGRLDRAVIAARSAVCVRSGDQRAGICVFGPDRGGVRLFPGPSRRQPQSDRRPAPRIAIRARARQKKQPFPADALQQILRNSLFATDPSLFRRSVPRRPVLLQTARRLRPSPTDAPCCLRLQPPDRLTDSGDAYRAGRCRPWSA